MAAPQFKVLERFSPETREIVAGRIFDRQTYGNHGTFYACAEGDCVMAALCHVEGIPLKSHDPTDRTLKRKLRATKAEFEELGQIVKANDEGAYKTREAVRTLLGVNSPDKSPQLTRGDE